MTLNEVMKETADAIREKKGTTEKIAPINFAEEIKSISAGGGESGGSNVEYLDVSAARVEIRGGLFQFGMLVKGHTTKGVNNMEISATGITPYYWNIMDNGAVVDSVKAVAIDFTHKLGMKADGNIMYITILEGLLQNGFTQAELDAIPRLTKEEFYTL